MQKDEQAIRNLVEKWMTATKAGDVATVLTLMADDVLFMVPGRPPFGKEAFSIGATAMKGFLFEGSSEIQELKVLGDWAWMRNRLQVTVTPPTGTPTTRSGYTLTILRKNPDGSWVIFRDANLAS
jgi:uncharacterized protein (TIGR02246 family)